MTDQTSTSPAQITVWEIDPSSDGEAVFVTRDNGLRLLEWDEATQRFDPIDLTFVYAGMSAPGTYAIDKGDSRAGITGEVVVVGDRAAVERELAARWPDLEVEWPTAVRREIAMEAVEAAYERAAGKWTGRCWDDGDRVEPGDSDEQIVRLWERSDGEMRVTQWGIPDDGSHGSQVWKRREAATLREFGRAFEEGNGVLLASACNDLRALARESDDGVARRAAIAEDMAAIALGLAREGDLFRAVEHARDTARIEREFGDAPTWGPFEAAVRALAEVE